MHLRLFLQPQRPDLVRAGGFVLLAGLSLAAETHAWPWLGGYPLSAAPVFLLILLRLYGLAWEIPAIALVYGVTLSTGLAAWPQIVPPIAFLVAVGLLLRRFPDQLIVLTGLYWLALGFPLSYFLYAHVSGYRDGLGVLYGLTGALDAFVAALSADLILSYSPVRRWLAAGGKPGYVLGRIVLHLTLVAIAAPFLCMILIYGYQEERGAAALAGAELDSQAEAVRSELAGWSADDYRALRLNGTIQVGELKNRLRMNAGHRPADMILVDGRGRTAGAVGSFAPPIGSPFDWRVGGTVHALSGAAAMWTPSDRYPFPSEARRYSYLAQETRIGADGGMKAVLLTPFYTYWSQSVQAEISRIQSLFIFLAAAVLLTLLLNRLFLRSLSALVEATTGIPDKMSGGGTLEWPKSDIYEIELLSRNFRSVTDSLRGMFSDTRRVNEQLRQQTDRLARSEERLYRLAYYDSLTGLPNRLNMKERLTKELEALAASGGNAHLSLLFIDLDRFKHINDTLGHDAGDELLHAVSERLMEARGDGMVISRHSGDEFVILQQHERSGDIVAIAERIIGKFAAPFMLQGNALYVTPSIGIASSPQHGSDFDTLMKKADSAMYAAKENGGKGFVVYSDILNARLSEKMWLENDLHKALLNQEFELYYQVKVDGTTKEVSGMEALVRWRHPDKGFVPPSAFIPVAEETGLIIPLGDWILRTACEQNVTWQRAGYPQLRIAVNLSARQFYDPYLVDAISGILADTGMSPRDLELEITEGYLVKNPEYVVEVLGKLTELGVFVSIDDFGTGYSSLGQLKKFPVHALKIDRSFVRNIDTDASNESIVKAVIQLARSMGLKVVAEGVESVKEENALRMYGCDELQGYLYGKPQPAASFEARLAELHAKVTEGGRKNA